MKFTTKFVLRSTLHHTRPNNEGNILISWQMPTTVRETPESMKYETFAMALLTPVLINAKHRDEPPTEMSDL